MVLNLCLQSTFFPGNNISIDESGIPEGEKFIQVEDSEFLSGDNEDLKSESLYQLFSESNTPRAIVEDSDVKPSEQNSKAYDNGKPNILLS